MLIKSTIFPKKKACALFLLEYALNEAIKRTTQIKPIFCSVEQVPKIRKGCHARDEVDVGHTLKPVPEA